MKPIASIITIMMMSLQLLAQVQPLSRQDSAIVDKYTENYHLYFTRGDKKEASRFLNEIAFIYWNHNQYPKAIEYYEQSLIINDEVDNENGVAMIHNNLGMLYADIGNYSTSLTHFDKTLAARRSMNEKIGIISALINISVVKNNLKQFDESISGLEEALTLARELNDIEQMRSVYGMLSETYQKAGDVELSIKYFNFYKSFHELMQKQKVNVLEAKVEEERIQKQLAEQKTEATSELLQEREVAIKQLKNELTSVESQLLQYDELTRSLYENLDKKELQLALSQQEVKIKEIKLQTEAAQREMNLQRERFIRYIMIGAILSLATIIFFVLLNYRNVSISKKKLEIKNTAINEHRTELRELNHLKDKLFAIISHDLRAPLSSLRGMMELMDANMLSQDEVKLFQTKLKQQARQSANLLDNLLLWAKSQMEGIKAMPGPINIKDLVEENIILLQPLADEKNISIQFLFSSSHTALADMNMIKLVIRNLLSNAIKFTHRGGNISITATDYPDYQSIEMKDSGVGMNTDTLENLFKVSTYSKPGTENEAGTGIGLLLCKEFVEINNGNITVKSEVNKGSIFTFTVPKT